MGLSDGSKQAFQQIFSAATNLLFNLHHLATATEQTLDTGTAGK